MSAGGVRNARDRPRIGVVTTELGIPSEIWAMRQLAQFQRIEPVLFAWSARSLDAVPEGVETHLFDPPFARPTGTLVRLGWRLGLPASVLPPRPALAAVRAALLAADLDAVLAHFAWNATRVTAALDGALPVVAQVHGRDVSRFLDNRAYRAALARTLPRLAHVAAVGAHQLERLRPLGLGPASVIPCGAPLAEFAARPLPERAPGQPLRLVTVGRLDAEKGVMETLEAFTRLAARHPAEWLCIGDGPLAGTLAAKAAEGPAAGKATFAGALPPTAVAEALAGAHVFAQHSRTHQGWVEGFGVAVTEAGAAGLPIVASRSGGLTDQVEDGVNGFLHAEGDVGAQAQALIRLAGDEGLRRRLGAEARRLAARFEAREMTRRLEDRLLAAAGRPEAEAGA